MCKPNHELFSSVPSLAMQIVAPPFPAHPLKSCVPSPPSPRQSMIPVLAMFCWGACSYACIFGYATNLEWFNVFSALTATPIQCWISVFNPLVTILTVMPYRRAVRSACCASPAAQ